MGIIKLLRNKLNQKTYSDEELISMIQTNGRPREKAVYFIHDQHLGYLLKMKEKYRFNEEEAIEVYGSALVYVDQYIHQGKFRGEAKISSLLYQVVKSRSIDFLRKKARAEKKRRQELNPDYEWGNIYSMPGNDHTDLEGSNQQDRTPRTTSTGQARVLTLDDIKDLSDTTVNAEKKMISEEKVKAIMSQLPEKGRRVLLDYANGYSIAEIMERHGYRNKRATTASIFNYKKQLIKIIERNKKAADD